MRASTLSLFKRAKAEVPKRFGVQPGLIITESELEKFAELVVLECINVCLEHNPSGLNYKPSEKFADAIKYHFGL